MVIVEEKIYLHSQSIVGMISWFILMGGCSMQGLWLFRKNHKMDVKGKPRIVKEVVLVVLGGAMKIFRGSIKRERALQMGCFNIPASPQPPLCSTTTLLIFMLCYICRGTSTHPTFLLKKSRVGFGNTVVWSQIEIALIKKTSSIL